MRVLLTTLPSPFLDNDRAFPQLGVLYLLAAAKKIGHYVKYLEDPRDAEAFSGNDVYYTDMVVDEPGAYNYFDAVMISAVTPQGMQARRLMLQLKNEKPEMLVGIGGPHATHYSQECLEAGFDHVFAGDGERSFLRFLGGQRLPFIMDRLTASEMNEYPPPLRDRDYLQNYGAYVINGRSATSMIVSRGCANRCAFCEDAGTPARWYSPKHFEQQVIDVTKAGFRAVMIYDDLFAISTKKVKPYAEILKRYDVIYRCFTHARSICRDPELARTLARTGCAAVGFGAESMDDGILAGVNKGTDAAMNQLCVERCVAQGINVKSFLMLGLPGETHESAQKTYDFIEYNRKKFPKLYDFDTASIYFPFKGTEIGDSLRAGEDRFDLQLLDGLTWEEIDRKCLGAHKSAGGGTEHITRTKGLTSIELWDWQLKLMDLSKRFAKVGEGFAPKEGVYEVEGGKQ